MSIYSKKLFDGYLTGAGAHALFTVPSGHTYVIRSITYSTFSAAVNQGYVGRAGNSVLAGWVNLAVLLPQTVNMRQVLNAGDALQCVLVTSDVLLAISGYDLT